MFSETRRKIALFFGRMEHRFGRLTGVMIFVTFLLIYMDATKTWLLVSIGVTFFCWTIYLLSHILEKKFYGNRGFR